MAEGEYVLCLKSSKLVKSHIIPLSFYKQGNPFFKKDDGIKIFSSKSSREKRSPNGVYSSIFCDACEKSFLESDSKIHFILKRYGNDSISRVTSIVDKMILDRFVPSLLLRAHFSTHKLFGNFDLGGKYVESIRAYLLGQSNYPDSILYFFCKYPKHVGIHSPSIFKRTEGFRFWVFYMGIYSLYLKIDSRPLPESHPFFCFF